MKNLDKKSIILLATLLAVAVIIIVFSQNILDKTGGNKFGSSYMQILQPSLTKLWME